MSPRERHVFLEEIPKKREAERIALKEAAKTP